MKTSVFLPGRRDARFSPFRNAPKKHFRIPIAAYLYGAGQAVSTALSPDGTQLLVLTSGFNAVADSQGKPQTNEYIFVFNVSVNPP